MPASFNANQYRELTFTAPSIEGYRPIACIGGGENIRGSIALTFIGLVDGNRAALGFRNVSSSATSASNLYTNFLYVKS